MQNRSPVRISGEPAIIEELTGVLRKQSEFDVVDVKIVENDEVSLDFNIELVATVVGLASSLFFDRAIVPTLWSVLRKRRDTTITIESPTATVTIKATAGLTEAQIEKVIAGLNR
jgi:hypothetical protein